ncbi:MAG: universal stress protein [Rickettsiales bacterium]
MESKKHSLLVCVNKEHYSSVALKYACNMAKEHGYSLTVLHVSEPAAYKTLGAIEEKMLRESREEAQKLLEGLVDSVCAPRGVMPSLAFREGFIDEEILAAMRDDPNICMLILGSPTDGSGSKSKVVPPLVGALGSKTAVPLLIVPGNVETE